MKIPVWPGGEKVISSPFLVLRFQTQSSVPPGRGPKTLETSREGGASASLPMPSMGRTPGPAVQQDDTEPGTEFWDSLGYREPVSET